MIKNRMELVILCSMRLLKPPYMVRSRNVYARIFTSVIETSLLRQYNKDKKIYKYECSGLLGVPSVNSQI